MFAQLNPHSSDFGDISALYPSFLHQLTIQSSLFETGRLRPCPRYSRRRDHINFVLLRSFYGGGGGQVSSKRDDGCLGVRCSGGKGSWKGERTVRCLCTVGPPNDQHLQCPYALKRHSNAKGTCPLKCRGCCVTAGHSSGALELGFAACCPARTAISDRKPCGNCNEPAAGHGSTVDVWPSTFGGWRGLQRPTPVWQPMCVPPLQQSRG